MSSPPPLIVNGEPYELPEPATVAALLARLGVAAARVAVEVNEEVIPRGSYEARRLAAGDRVEIVHFVGGG
ncbi:MAG: thiamine biosynthesis protein ThiS [Polyangiaceae bacterium UTPRO1]|jgi:thiamine biosynthesis protein ThiS|nr:sulfur carrier protein ThiS [Myxococcales bacterium]OQY69225.1 MAG: thiamine biosynthesis protein ThiS [Polyangiaceae bacterium UTPRO1]